MPLLKNSRPTCNNYSRSVFWTTLSEWYRRFPFIHIENMEIAWRKFRDSPGKKNVFLLLPLKFYKEFPLDGYSSVKKRSTHRDQIFDIADTPICCSIWVWHTSMGNTQTCCNFVNCDLNACKQQFVNLLIVLVRCSSWWALLLVIILDIRAAIF